MIFQNMWGFCKVKMAVSNQTEVVIITKFIKLKILHMCATN